MATLKRKYSGMERELARTLTTACETAKSEIVGFQWLTHDVDYERFPQSLMVTWVFDTEASKESAIASPDRARMHDLTLASFEEVGITVSNIAAHVEFRSEQRLAPASGNRGAQQVSGKRG